MERPGRAEAPPLAAPRQASAAAAEGYFGKRVAELLAQAGIEVDGGRSWDIRVRRDRFYRRALGGSLGIGESYMDGDWDCERLDEFVARVFRADLPSRIRPGLRVALAHVGSALFNRWGRFAVRRKVAPHYDLGNDLFVRMLDESTMAYTCGYWQSGAKTLEEAQEAKFDLICRKLTLEPGMRVLEIGCGWGSFAKFAAENYGVNVHGVTLSKEQAALGMERCAGLPVELLVQDYRDVEGSFDRVVSIGCLEHVGHRNHRTFFRKIHQSLDGDGYALVHAIGTVTSRYLVGGFLDKYVFPLVNIPSVAQIGRAVDGLFVVEDMHNIGPDYDPTLIEWNKRFQKAWPELEPRYGHLLNGRFKRMFEFYLLGCAGFARARGQQVWQTVLTRFPRRQPICRVN